jgi:hypothetical protein
VTAKANDGLCAPCLGRKRKEERAKFIRENKREVDPFAGITDPVEILRTLHTPRKYDPLIAYGPPPKPAEELYAELNKADAIRLMDIASKARLAGKDDFAEEIAKSLATLTTFSLDQMLKAWISRNDYWPAIIFRNAGPEIRDAVVSALDAGTANANHALSALAWIGDAVVQDRFRRWDKENPPWRKKLYIPPSEYSTVAGWELTSRGRRNLFYKDCFAIKPAIGEPDKAVKMMEVTNLACPWCSRKLVKLIELDLSDDRFRGPASPPSKTAGPDLRRLHLLWSRLCKRGPGWRGALGSRESAAKVFAGRSSFVESESVGRRSRRVASTASHRSG